MNEGERERERGMGYWKSERRRDKSATNRNERKMLFKQNEWESHLYESLWPQAGFHLFAFLFFYFFCIIYLPNKYKNLHLYNFSENMYFLNKQRQCGTTCNIIASVFPA